MCSDHFDYTISIRILHYDFSTTSNNGNVFSLLCVAGRLHK